MTKQGINIVWLKRDLRTQDHLPLKLAEDSDTPYIILYLIEPSLLKRPDWSPRHLWFALESIKNINVTLKECNKQVEVLYSEAEEIFNSLSTKYQILNIFSHAETGVKETWDRDVRLRNHFKSKRINWIESPTNGVIRGINSRNGWDRRWYETMRMPIIHNRYSNRKTVSIKFNKPLPKSLTTSLSLNTENFQPPGEKYAWEYLSSFVVDRSEAYLSNISNPSKSKKSCSRISVYLSWGNISSKQCYQYIKYHPKFDQNKRNFNGFLTRLKWRCHFMQKFEDECEYETRCINRGYELLERERNQEFITNWMRGKTGFPMIDASIRSVVASGWLNFRMRAMLVSFFCHHLDQDWRDGANFLAKQFLDYEPGIHFPQFQMQAGTTGINTIRIYNPVKQSQDHDKEGVFIKEWIPELESCPVDSIHEPWKYYSSTDFFQDIKPHLAYHKPIIDHKIGASNARKKIWGHRSNDLVKLEKQRILDKHTRSNKLRMKT